MHLEDARLRRFGDPGAVIVVRLDQLATIDDASGHEAGETFVRRAAEIIARAVRSIDIVARLGGSEFGVIATDLIPLSSEILVDRILDAFEAAGVAGSIGCAPYTIVAGFAGAFEQAHADLSTHRGRRSLGVGSLP